ncbi:MAG: ammonia channel protein, partial [Gammaproteobacteria bacterium]|nr:ammonia channel protein [Gammaproteobacteria bacterium]
GVEGSVLTQLIACMAVLTYSLVMTGVVLWITSRVARLRVHEVDERAGLDLSLHNEQLGH